MTTRLKIIIFAILIALPTIIYAKDKTVTISVTSEPAGAKVYVDGKLIGTTPCKAEFIGKWVYDIDANRVNPNKPPYQKNLLLLKMVTKQPLNTGKVLMSIMKPSLDNIDRNTIS